MPKSTFTPAYQLIRARLVELRKAAGLTQRDLARKLDREHSFVGRFEVGERRLDLVEFAWICRACGAEPVKVMTDLLKAISKLESSRVLPRR